MSKIRTGLIAALDVGSTKLCCFIARADASSGIRVIGIGHQMAKGVRNGAIVDMDAAEISIRNAVHAAEQMAGETIEQLVVNISCGNPSSRTVGVEVSI
ncbi:MAG: cell division FtsA domain-containing protein, partial [Georgenia sp.]